MNKLGFELMCKQTVSVTLGDCFKMVMVINGKEIRSSCGKDIYHASEMILPNRIVAATGRISYSNNKTFSSLMQSCSPCVSTSVSNHQINTLGIKVTFPSIHFIELLNHFVVIGYWNKKKWQTWLDCKYVQWNDSNQIYVTV
ncbi:hypothetical protein LC040_00710 [Bacillus tianshenii]|nr:hypothetical protein LC040_00710 [Bacillus tianshenii]